MRRNRRFLNFLRYSAYAFTLNWAFGLALFFHDPEWAKAAFRACFGMETAEKLPYKSKVPCTEYESVAWTLNDEVEDYWEHSRAAGIEEPAVVEDVRSEYRKGKLVLIEPTENYDLDTLYHSYAFATPGTKQFIDTLAVRFRAKLVNTDLNGARLTLTSLLRTKSSVARLRKRNRNALRHSSHLHGTTFDISYATYGFERPVSVKEAEYLREVLARTLSELRAEKKCWVKYEIYQTCFHVVTS